MIIPLGLCTFKFLRLINNTFFSNLIYAKNSPSDFYSLKSRNFKYVLLWLPFLDSVALEKAA